MLTSRQQHARSHSKNAVLLITVTGLAPVMSICNHFMNDLTAICQLLEDVQSREPELEKP